jgi:hypothetical protein
MHLEEYTPFSTRRSRSRTLWCSACRETYQTFYTPLDSIPYDDQLLVLAEDTYLPCGDEPPSVVLAGYVCRSCKRSIWLLEWCARWASPVRLTLPRGRRAAWLAADSEHVEH